MKKASIYLLSSAILLSSCYSTSSRGYLGTMAGAEIGGTIGEAIGWISTSRHDGPGKAMLGSVIGTVAGAVIGHKMATQGQTSSTERVNRKRNTQTYEQRNDQNVYETPDFQTGGGYSDVPATSNGLSIGNVSFQDENGDGKFSQYETINVIYEVTNHTNRTQEVQLSIDNPAYAKEIAFSPVNTTTIQAGKTIRYKAKAFRKSTLKADYVDIQVFAKSADAGSATASLRVRCE